MLLLFGKNLKKIRSVHGLSQQQFADIFDLKRGTLGAYEENRSNPKLETVIRIANHFSIGVEDLLISELTVNKLLKFNERLAVGSDSLKAFEFAGIPCVLPKDKSEFIKNYSAGFDLSQLSELKLPYVEVENRLAFAVDDLAMTSGVVEFFPKDIVIGVKIDVEAIEENNLVVALTKDELLLRRFSKDHQHFILKADHHGVEDVKLLPEDLICIWKIEHVFNYSLRSKEILLENRLAVIEETIASLKIQK